MRLLKATACVLAIVGGILAAEEGVGLPARRADVPLTERAISTAAAVAHSVSSMDVGGGGNGMFAAQVTYPAGYGPFTVAIEDLDGDGDADLAVANPGCPSGAVCYGGVSVLLNNGDGTFAAQVTYAAGGNLTFSVAIEDLDGDGDADLAVANRDTDNVSILLNNGDGTFPAQVTYATGNGPFSVAIEDLDGDGDADLAVANYGDDNVSVLLNNGNGTFAAQVTYATPLEPHSVAIEDLDTDGDADLAVTNFNIDRVSILLNNGDGTFAARVTYSVGDGPVSVAIGDLDGDWDADLAVANFKGDNVSVLLNLRVEDCNGNGIPDQCDIDCEPPGGFCDVPSCGQSEDCTPNGIPDECEPDCGGDTIPDTCEIADCPPEDPSCQDCNGNRVPDGCDIADCPPEYPACQDCNSNGTPDECEPDCNTNNIADSCDIADGTSVDCQPNGIPDECEPDCNGNGIADSCDILDGISEDCTGNGVPDECETDCNGNGVVDSCDIDVGHSLDCNANGVPDECEIDQDSEAPGAPFYCTVDCDPDCNENGVPDDCEPGGDVDCNDNGTSDMCDIFTGTSVDCTGNGIPDDCEPDCQPNGIADSCDIAGVWTALPSLMVEHEVADPQIAAAVPRIVNRPLDGGCATQELYDARQKAAGRSLAGVCPTRGDCDQPEVRNGFIPTADTPIKLFRVLVHRYCESDGTQCVTTENAIDEQMARVNEEFAPYQIRFTHQTVCHHDSEFLDVENPLVDRTDGEDLKGKYAVSPATQINVYVVNVSDGISWGTFPWESGVLANLGGVVLNSSQLGSSTLGHELGHCLGLWHTFHSVDDERDLDPVTLLVCDDPCRDVAGGPDGNSTGDFCSDTAPTPLSWGCGDPGGTDECNDVPWGATDFSNLMSYSSCRDHFTYQQTGRLHCWTEHALTGWLAGATSDDCNDNGVPDECEVGACCLDADHDGDYEGCAMESSESCEAGCGVFRGPCAECPEQNAAIIPEPGGGVFVHVIGAPIDCLAATGPTARRGDCPPDTPRIDPWKSDAAAQMCHNFGVPGSPPIPADFFGPGSDPFVGAVCLEGVPLGPTAFGDFGDADTLIARSADPFDRCDLPSGTPAPPVEIEVVALSLVSTDPITVTYNGGQNPEEWSAVVDLSAVGAPPGTLTATKTHCNGGTYTSVLNVQPRFSFSKVADPGTTAVLDTGLDGIAHVTLDQQDPVPWVGDVDPNLGLTADPCTDFHPGIEDVNQLTTCDCNNNNIRDKCDLDTDGDSVPDDCDNCPIDFNPDQESISSPAAVEMIGTDVSTKNRFLSFTAGDPARMQAIRVTFDSLPPPFDLWNGTEMWVGPTRLATEAGATVVPNEDYPNFTAGTLQCAPLFTDWSSLGTIHVFHEGIVPEGSYRVDVVDESCDRGVSTSFSVALSITTAYWGDTLFDLSQTPPTPPNGPPVGIVDALGVLGRFSNAPGAIIKARADLHPACVDLKINVTDVLGSLAGFVGLSYPFLPTAPDPCNSTCPSPWP